MDQEARILDMNVHFMIQISLQKRVSSINNWSLLMMWKKLDASHRNSRLEEAIQLCHRWNKRSSNWKEQFLKLHKNLLEENWNAGNSDITQSLETLKMKGPWSFEMSGNTRPNHISEDSNLWDYISFPHFYSTGHEDLFHHRMYKGGEALRGKPDDMTTRQQMSAAEVVEKIKKY